MACPPAADHSPQLHRRLAQVLDARLASKRLRRRRPLILLDATHVEIDGRRLINFAGNDYLGLSHHPALRSSPGEVSGAGASALVCGYTADHANAEACIARWKNTESAVLLPSGYQANLAAIQTFAGIGGEPANDVNERRIRGQDKGMQSVRFLLDKLSHASLIDAVRSTGSPFRIFPHNHVDKLWRLLKSAPRDQQQVIVTESIFSMDGDACPLATLCALREEFGCALLLDEAHGSGVYGVNGAGLAAELKLSDSVDVTVCTFSKAAGLIGGAVGGSNLFCEALANFGRAYIYSTAIPPSLARQIGRAIQLMAEEPERQQKLRRLANDVRSSLTSSGWNLPDGDSPIIPIIVGDEAKAIAAADHLQNAGLLAVAIRPPTVKPNACRLRITLNAAHEPDQISLLLTSLNDLL